MASEYCYNGQTNFLGQSKRNDVIITAMLLFDHFDDHQWLWKSNPHPELTNEIATCGKTMNNRDSDDVKVPHFIGWTIQSTTGAVADTSCR